MSRLRSFETKILRKIYGPICDRGEWRIRYNSELYRLYKYPEVVTSIKVSRLQWSGHVQRMAEHEIPKKIMGNKFEGKRSVGRPRLRWMDGVLEDLRKLRIKGWWLVAWDREAGKKVLREAEAQIGL